MRHRPVIAFLVPSPFEILDLTGPVSVFERAAVNGERYYSIRILSTRSDGAVRTEGGMAIADTCKYSDYVGPIDTLIVSGGVGAVPPQSPELTKWLRERATRTRRVASTCTGAFSSRVRGCSMDAALRHIGNTAILSRAAISTSRWSVTPSSSNRASSTPPPV